MDFITGGLRTPGLLAPDAVRWQAPPGGELAWGRLFNFAFDADAAATASQVDVMAG